MGGEGHTDVRATRMSSCQVDLPPCACSQWSPAMLTIFGRQDRKSRFCDGLTRRGFLSIGGAAVGGLTLSQLLQLEAQAGVRRSHKAIINIYLPGGPSHIDMWDPKPNAPAEIRGEFSPISTNVPGIQICELFPKIAQMMDKFVIVRSLA